MLLVLCLVITQALIVSADDIADSTPPVINSISVVNYDATKTYTADDTLNVRIDAMDNIQLFDATVVWRNVDNESLDYYFSYQKGVIEGGINDNPFDINVPISKLPSGKYKLISVQVYDSSNNSTYNNSNDFGQYEINVYNPDYTNEADSKFDIIDLSVTPKEGSSKTTDFTYTIKIKDNIDDIARVQIGLKNTFSSSHGFDCTLTDSTDTDNVATYKCIVNISEQMQSYIRTIKLDAVTIYDKDGNIYQYIPKYSYVEGTGIFPIDCISEGDVDIELTDIEEDKDLPELVSYGYDKEVIYTPDVVLLNVEGKDDTTWVGEVEYVLKSKNDDSIILQGGCSENIDTEDPNDYKAMLDFPRYTGKAGEYYISELTLYDAARNSKTYSVEDGTLEEKCFEVINNNDVDYVTSTAAPEEDLLKTISRAAEENGKTVLINISEAKPIIKKEVFEAIAGKNVTLIFEKIYDYAASSESSDEGLQWIMHGEDIDISKAKDINAYFYIEVSTDYTWLNEQEEKHNSKIPSLDIEEEMAWEEYIDQTKNYFDENGWGDVVSMIESMQEPGEDFIDALSRIAYPPCVKFVFADNGELPGKSTIRFKPAYSMRYFLNDYDLNLYYIDEQTGEFELIYDDIDKHEEGYYQFDLYHNSEYALANKPANGVTSDDNGNSGTNNGESNSNNPNKEVKTGDNVRLALWIALMLLSAIGITGVNVYSRKKKTNE